MSSRAVNYRQSAGSPLADPTPPPGARDPAQDAVQDKAPPATSAAGKDTAPQTLDAIRREGLTPRQLRMARRIAARKGVAFSGEHDAVRQLRARGIDPFDHTAVLALVDRPARTPGAGAAPAQPGAAPPAPSTPTAPAPQADPAQARASDILQIQRDIARRRRGKVVSLVARLAAFVLLPAALAGYYYFFVATPLYATKSEFTIQQAEAQGATGLGGLFQGTGLAVQQDSTTVQSFLQSRDAMLRLDSELGFRTHWSAPGIDPVQRLGADAGFEEAYDLYRSKVRIGFDPSEGILKMEVIATDATTSQAFAERLIAYAEEQVDNLTQRLRDDQMQGARDSYAEAEEKMRQAQARVLDLQERMGVLDPMTETSSVMSQITQFETQLHQKQLELSQLLANPQPNSAKVNGVRGDIERLRALVANLRASMTESAGGTASLARITGELRIAEADLATRQLLLQQAAGQLETARIEAARQTRYITVGVSPVAPDRPTYPRAVENTALALVIFAGIYLMLSLTVSVLREQVTA